MMSPRERFCLRTFEKLKIFPMSYTDVIISSGNKLVCKHDFVNLETGEWLCDYDAATFRRNNPDNPYLEEVLQDSKIRESGVDLIIDVKQRGIIHRLLFFLSEAIRDYGWSGMNAIFCVNIYIYIYIDWFYYCFHSSGPDSHHLTSCICIVGVYGDETRLSRTSSHSTHCCSG